MGDEEKKTIKQYRFKVYYEKNKAILLEKQKEKYKSDPEFRQKKLENSEKNRLLNRKFDVKPKQTIEDIQAYKKQYYIDNKEYMLSKSKARYQARKAQKELAEQLEKTLVI